MIKLTIGLKRLPSLSREQFASYWTQQHAGLVKQHAAALGIVHYSQVHRLFDTELEAFGLPASASLTFDGIAEVWFSNLASAASSGRTADGRTAMKALRADECKFLDSSQSLHWIGRRRSVF